MIKVAIRDQKYEVTRITYKEWVQLAKYVNSLSIEQNACLTPELDRAAAHALRKIIPTLDPAIANNDNGIDLEFLTEFYPLYKELEAEFKRSQNTVEVSIEETPEQEKERLMKRIKQLEDGA